MKKEGYLINDTDITRFQSRRDEFESKNKDLILEIHVSIDTHLVPAPPEPIGIITKENANQKKMTFMPVYNCYYVMNVTDAVPPENK